MISIVRSYLKQIIKGVSSDFKEWGFAFDSDNIPETLGDKSFFIKYDVNSIIEQDTTVEMNIGVRVEFFFKLYTDRLVNYDKAMDLVNQILLSAINIHSIEDYKVGNDNPIYKVLADSMTTSQVETNDNQLIITLELTCGILQTKC